MTTNLVLNNRPNRKGLHCIFIRITKNRKHYSTSSEIYVKKNQFDKGAKHGKWIVKHLDSASLNEALKRKITAIEGIYLSGQEVSPQAALMGDNFFYYADQFKKQFNNEAQIGTYLHYDVVLNKIEEFCGNRKLKFSEITVKFLRDFSTFWKGKGNKVNTIGFSLKKIRAIIRAAVKEEIVSWAKNPFNNFQIETERTGKEKLTNEELDLLRKCFIGNENYKIHVRNVFLFCINCMGMRIGSALKIKKIQVNKGSLTYQMNKGGKMKNIELTKEANDIVKFYYDSPGEYLFPYLNNCTDIYKKINSTTALINAALREMAEDVGIKKHISTHVARHSFTKMAIDANIDMRTLQGMLDHSSVKTTEGYAGDIADVTGNDALKKIFK